VNNVEVTFVTISYCVNINVEFIYSKQHQAKPRIKTINRDKKENSNNPALFSWDCIVFEVLVNLKKHKIKDMHNQIHVPVRLLPIRFLIITDT